MKLYRTSVKEDLNVAVVFQHLAENYVNKVSEQVPVELPPMMTGTTKIRFKKKKKFIKLNFIKNNIL